MTMEADYPASAEIVVSYCDGYFHVRAATVGDSVERAKWMAERILWFLAENRDAYLRNEPEAKTSTDYGTTAKLHHGYVRFSFRDEPGKWHKPAPSDQMQELTLTFVPVVKKDEEEE